MEETSIVPMPNTIGPTIPLAIIFGIIVTYCCGTLPYDIVLLSDAQNIKCRCLELRKPIFVEFKSIFKHALDRTATKKLVGAEHRKY